MLCTVLLTPLVTVVTVLLPVVMVEVDAACPVGNEGLGTGQ